MNGRKLEYKEHTVDCPFKPGWLFSFHHGDDGLDLIIETEDGRLLNLMPRAVRFIDHPPDTRVPDNGLEGVAR